MPPAAKHGQREAQGQELFPSTWPSRAWSAFAEALLPVVYPKSSDLWHVLRDTSREVTGWLEHLEYEGEIERDGRFNAATTLIPSWSTAEAQLHQARTLLGRQVWNSLISSAEVKTLGRSQERRSS